MQITYQKTKLILEVTNISGEFWYFYFNKRKVGLKLMKVNRLSIRRQGTTGRNLNFRDFYLKEKIYCGNWKRCHIPVLRTRDIEVLKETRQDVLKGSSF